MIPKSAPLRSLSPAVAGSRQVSGLKRSVIHMLVALVIGLATPAAAQFAGGGELPVLMPVNVESVEVGGAFLRNGRAFPANFLDSGNFYIESPDGDPFFLGNSSLGSYGPLRLVSGIYEPQFASFLEPATAPLGNRAAFSDPIIIEADQTLALNVPAIPVGVSFLLNGAAFPSQSGELADFYLRNLETGREVKIGTSQQTFNTIYVVPGVYSVIYAYQSGIFIPPNTKTIILEKVRIDQAMSLEVDVPMVLRTVSAMLNGVPFPASGLDYGTIYLEDVSTKSHFYIGATNETSLLRAIPGNYRVIYSFRETQGLSPTNPWAIVDDNLSIETTGSSSIRVEVTTHTVDPVFSMDGLPFPGGPFAYALIQYRADNGTFVTIGRTDAAPEPRTLIEGIYKFYYRLWEPDPSIPANWQTLFAADVIIDESGPLPLDVETAVLDLDLLLDGERFPNLGLDYGLIFLVEAETGVELKLGRSFEMPLTRRVVKGEYNFVYRFQESQGVTPTNTSHVIARGVQLDGLTPILIDVRTQLIAPRFTLDGAAFPDTESQYGQFTLRDEDGDRVWLGHSYEDASDKRVIEGAYQVNYEWQSGTEVPANPRESIQSVWVPEPGFAAGLLASLLWIGGFARYKLYRGGRSGKVVPGAQGFAGSWLRTCHTARSTWSDSMERKRSFQ